MRNTLWRTGLVWLWLTGLIIAIDRISKDLVMQHLDPYQPLPITSFFNLTLAFNKGAAFSFLQGASGWQNIFFSTIAFFISMTILVWLYRTKYNEILFNTSLCLILGGAIGNVWDRLLFRHVIDFFDFHLGDWHFAIFNVADSAICIGAAFLFIHWVQSTTKTAEKIS